MLVKIKMRRVHLIITRKTSVNIALNTAVILTTEYLEVSIVSPIGIPGVCTEPIWYTILLSPTHNLDGMTTQQSSTDMLVDTRFVARKVSINFKISLNRSMCEKLVSYCVFVSINRVDLRGCKSRKYKWPEKYDWFQYTFCTSTLEFKATIP